jgi:hypothetical protein
MKDEGGWGGSRLRRGGVCVWGLSDISEWDIHIGKAINSGQVDTGREADRPNKIIEKMLLYVLARAIFLYPIPKQLKRKSR